jgi:hypothetical protein
MPSNSVGTIAIGTRVVAQAAYGMSKEDTIALLFQIPPGGTIVTLPRADTIAESYEVVDVDGSCSATNPIILEASGGQLIQGGASQTFVTPFSDVRAIWTGTGWALVVTDGKADVGGADFVWKPGTASEGNSFGPWADLQAAINSVGEAHYTVTVDVSAGAAVVPGGATLGNGTWYAGAGGAPFVSVTFTGAISFSRLENAGNLLRFVANSPAAPVFTLPAVGESAQLIVRDQGYLLSLTAEPFVLIPNLAQVFFFFTSGQVFLGDGVHPVFNCAAGQFICVLSDFTLVHANAFAGTGGQVEITSGVQLPTPALPDASWSFTAIPPNFVQAPALAAGPAATVSITTGNLSRQYSGQVLVQATICGLTSVAAVLTASLLMDGAATGAPTVKTQTTVAEEFSLTLLWWLALPDFLTHTFGVSVTASAGTITQAAGVGGIVATEIKV